MRVVVLPDPESVAVFASLEIARQVISNPRSVLGLATGGTPLGAYRQLIDLHREKGFSFSNVTTFNLDEYVGLSPDQPESYRFFMNANLFQHLDIPMEQTHVPRGDARDLRSECEKYELKLEIAGGIDIQLLGVGTDGHIGFNEPGSSLASRTRIKSLTESTRRDNTRFFSCPNDVPSTAITMGVGTILDAKRILLLATGRSKAEAIQAAIEGPITSFVPASALQLHADVTIVIDSDAASLLIYQEYYVRSEAERNRLGIE